MPEHLQASVRYEVWQANIRGGWSLYGIYRSSRRARLQAVLIRFSYPRGSVYARTKIEERS